MKLGDSGDEVKYVQELLNSHGLSCSIDGSFGPSTQRRVIEFQKLNGISSDGIVGPKTLSLLEGPKHKEVITPVEFDERTEKVLKTLDPKAIEMFRPFIREAKEIASKMGYNYIALSGTRSKEEQNALYAKGRTKPGPKVTNARWPYSNHNHGIALDFGVFKDGKYLDESLPRVSESVHRAVAKLCEKYQISWGGDWKTILDFPHFEIKTSLSMSEKIRRVSERGTIFPI